ncbi:MAG: hypothetical protein VKS61_03690 [Candidatus Sericytochromatia bacterium]|nr:hypothetical protein [Candidatus Sericytochromatia bacterium]
MALDPGSGALWIYGQGRLGRWRPEQGWEVVAEGGDRWFDPGAIVSGLAVGLDGAPYYILKAQRSWVGRQIARLDPETRTETAVSGPGGLVFTGKAGDDSLGPARCLAFAPNGELVVVDAGTRQVRRASLGSLLPAR